MKLPVACGAAVAILLAGCTAAPAPNPTPPLVREVAVVDPVVAYARDRLGVMSLEQRVASMLMVHVPGLDPGALGGFAAEYGLGGLILMGDNVPDPPDALAATVPAMTGSPDLPVLIGIDQEGGTVSRIDTDDGPSAEQLRYEDPGAAETAFAARAAMLHALGITVNFGIVADVTGDPDSFIFDRSMGATAADAAARVAAAVTGEGDTVLSTLKHFPGHGVAPGDSHTMIPETAMSLADWRTGHEPPFAAGIEAGAQFVMFGHLQFDSVDPVPATLSVPWHALLRDELGFDGIAITDDMNMLEDSGRPEYADPARNAVLAVAAGNTMLLYVHSIDVPAIVVAVSAAVRSGEIPVSTVNDAALRLLELRRSLATGDVVHCLAQCAARME